MIKPRLQYNISVEGETEKWYFEHIKNLINKHEKAKFRVGYNPKIDTSPLSFSKTIKETKLKSFHICDYESNEEIHVNKFKKVLDELKELRKKNGSYKYIKSYSLGYSNFTFELWMVLHKIQCYTPLNHRKQYVTHINNAYGTKYQFIDEYKSEDKFKKILSTIEIDDVINAVSNARKIRAKNMESEKRHNEYTGFYYYKDNPDLTIHEVVETILKDCKIL